MREKPEGGPRDLHTPLHLLVNRINQRHHGLSLLGALFPSPFHPAAPRAINLCNFLDGGVREASRRAPSHFGGGDCVLTTSPRNFARVTLRRETADRVRRLILVGLNLANLT